ncbi:type IV pilus modification PilV family protein [Sandaracinus amylolyticus]|uniref:General secretion pathway protein I n=1 Tax=Sandaracinus amylolyticus TaxID=927083 RepID=A0A0F6SDR8_9BACT|nr:type II secretion system protein [Sandaracinus amylolyticus]AKF03919.1 General secretion pathway protein I [Sandaracinus amylolyticus]
MRRAGFTLLEVMVAVAILAIALTAIFASEAGAIRVAARARFTTTATLLARCKMAEIEEQMAREGLPAVSATSVDACCEDGEVEGFECEWEISRIVLPDQASTGEEELAEGLGAAAEGAEGEEGGGPQMPDVTSIMSGAMMGGGGDMVAEMALQYAFPVLKPQIEEQVRRARVTVRWHEGDEERSFDVVQYLVAEQPPAAVTQQAADQLINGPGSSTTPPPGTQTPPGRSGGGL